MNYEFKFNETEINNLIEYLVWSLYSFSIFLLSF